MCCNNVPKRILPMWGFGNLLAYNRGKVVPLLWTLQGEKVYNLTQLRRNHKNMQKIDLVTTKFRTYKRFSFPETSRSALKRPRVANSFGKTSSKTFGHSKDEEHLYHCIESGKLTPFSKRRAMNPPRRKSTWVSTKKWRTLKLKTMLNNVLC